MCLEIAYFFWYSFIVIHSTFCIYWLELCLPDFTHRTNLYGVSWIIFDSQRQIFPTGIASMLLSHIFGLEILERWSTLIYRNYMHILEKQSLFEWRSRVVGVVVVVLAVAWGSALKNELAIFLSFTWWHFLGDVISSRKILNYDLQHFSRYSGLSFQRHTS